ncbi:MAG: hypothetical protein NTZ97_04545 [Candidatus Moranbacteria bacterium]|nr:hypothetical protein [Candidatus Moranbacteria bacterium]
MNFKNIFIISGPSGAGEDSIIKGLEKIFPLEKIITTATRQMRLGESQGNPYYFITKEIFQEEIRKNEFFEYVEEDRNNFYGVTKKETERVLGLNKIILWKLDYKGVITAKKLFPESIAILIDVPIEVIEERIRRRDGVDEKYIQGRLEYARGWYDNRDKFDYSIKNAEGRLDEAIQKVAEIIKKNISQ